MGTVEVGAIYQHIYNPERQIQVLALYPVRHVPCARVKYISTFNKKNEGLTSTITCYYIDARYERISFDNTKSEWEV